MLMSFYHRKIPLNLVVSSKIHRDVATQITLHSKIFHEILLDETNL